ncbi:MAG: hypothetical protein QGH83_11045 [Candidatus Pacebacteria bacterium]|jgi:hypothetical protein|nr:hypothetical protein [Candidatus Paceibacterota bacterium]
MSKIVSKDDWVSPRITLTLEVGEWKKIQSHRPVESKGECERWARFFLDVAVELMNEQVDLPDCIIERGENPRHRRPWSIG